MESQAPLGSDRLNIEMLLPEAKDVRDFAVQREQGLSIQQQQMVRCSLAAFTRALNPGCEKPELKTGKRTQETVSGRHHVLPRLPANAGKSSGTSRSQGVSAAVRSEERGRCWWALNLPIKQATNTFNRPCLDKSAVCLRLGKILEKKKKNSPC